MTKINVRDGLFVGVLLGFGLQYLFLKKVEQVKSSEALRVAGYYEAEMNLSASPVRTDDSIR
jgi:hypothetical protein